MADELKSITREDVRKFFDQHIYKRDTRRMFSIQVFGKSRTIPEEPVDVWNDNTYIIEDIFKFKQSCHIYPSCY